MSTITTKVYICKTLSQYDDAFHFFCCDMTQYGYVTLAVHELTFPIPEPADMVQAEVDFLNKEKEKIQAKAHVELKHLDDRLQQLLALEAPKNGS